MSIIHQLNEISSGYADWIWSSVWQSAVLGLAVLIVVRTFSRIPVSIKYALLLLAIIKFVVPPNYSLPVGLFSRIDVNSVALHSDLTEPFDAAANPVDRSFAEHGPPPTDLTTPNPSIGSGMQASAEISDSALRQSLDPTGDRPVSSTMANAPTKNDGPIPRLSIASCFLIFHLLGTLIFLGWIALQICKLHRLVRSSEVVQPSALFGDESPINNLLRGIRLRQNPNAHSPMAFGVIRPTIMLPSSLVEGDSSRLRGVVLHEVAHIRRRDILARWLEIPVLAMWWFHPVLWMLSRSISNVREDCCDDFSVDSGATDEYEYCQTLLHVAQHIAPSQGTRLSCGINDSHPVARRISRLMNPNRVKASKLGVLGLVSIMAVALSVLPGLNTSQVASAQQRNDRTPSVSNADESGNEPTGAVVTGTEPTGAVASETVEPNDDTSRPEVVSGVLIDAADGKPVAEAKVMLRGRRTRSVTSDQAGRFRFEKVPAYANGYRLWAYRENMITELVRFDPIASDNTDGPSFNPLRLEMRRGRQARFVIASEKSREPIAGASIRFGYPDRRKALTGEDGVATFSGLLQQQYEVTLEAEGHARNGMQIDLALGDDVSEYAVTLVPGGEVQGVVVDQDGEPVKKAEIVYWEPNKTGYHGDAYRTDANGQFRHRYLPLNVPMEVSVNKDGYIRAKQQFSLLNDQPSREMRITLSRGVTQSRPPPGRSIAGVVRDQQQNPIPDATVETHGDGSSKKLVTNTATKPLKLDGAEPVTITLQEAGQLRGQSGQSRGPVDFIERKDAPRSVLAERRVS